MDYGTGLADSSVKKVKAENNHSDFSEKVALFQDPLYRYVYSRLFDADIADDIVQDTFLSAYRNYGSLRNKKAFFSWICSIARRNIIRLKNKSDKWNIAEKNVSILPGRAGLPEDELDNKEISSCVRKSVSGLNEGNRMVIVLFYFSGFGIRRIARELSLSEDAVKKRLERSRKRIKEEMILRMETEISGRLPSANPDMLARMNFQMSFERAALLGQLSLVEALLMDGLDVNARDMKGRTILHWTAESGHLDIAQLLVRCGAKANIKDKNGMTAVDYAKKSGQYELQKLLCSGRTDDE